MKNWCVHSVLLVTAIFIPIVGNCTTFITPSDGTKLSNCEYKDMTCPANKTRYHTGQDYDDNNTLNVRASNVGKVVRVENKNNNDHGMGTNIIIEHILNDNSKIYTSYSHLESITNGIVEGSCVDRGEVIGQMGGSGYNDSDYYGVHLHFEVKNKAVTGSPNPENSYWGYTPNDPNTYGYKNPYSYINTIEAKYPPGCGINLYAFIKKTDPICVTKTGNNFYASFRIKNNSTEPTTIDNMAIAIYRKNGSFYKDCWLKGTPTRIEGNGYWGTDKQSCRIAFPGEFELVAKLFMNNEWKHMESKSFRILPSGECLNNTKIQPIISKLLLNNSRSSSGFISANSIVSGNIRFEDQDGFKMPLPNNAWVRIVPEHTQIEGNYDGINCKIIPSSYSSNFSGSFGQLFCYVRSQDTLNYFDNPSEKFQIVIYEQTQNQGEDGWALFDKDEFSYCGYSSPEEMDLNLQPYGAWIEHTCTYNGPGVTESGGNDRSALISPNGGEIWVDGESESIQWMAQYITGSTVDLYVLHDDPSGLLDKNDLNIGYKINRKNWYRFAHSIPNNGTYSVDPQELSGAGNAYMILVVSESDNSKFDLSDATFTLSN